jgi:hypothetical protein
MLDERSYNALLTYFSRCRTVHRMYWLLEINELILMELGYINVLEFSHNNGERRI